MRTAKRKPARVSLGELFKTYSLVLIGPPEHIAREMDSTRLDFFETCFIASAATWDGRGGCILLHAVWGQRFIEGIQRDANRRVEKQLERGPR